MYINAHDHLDFYRDLPQALKEMEEEKILTLANSMDLAGFLKLKEIPASHPWIKIGLGIHPWKVTADTDYRDYEKYVRVADFVGEIGLDYFWAKDKSLYPKQKEVFQGMLLLAQKYQKIPNIHTKGAEEDVLFLLQSLGLKKPIIHWYSGPLNLVEDFLALGSYFTISVDVGHNFLTDQLIDILPLERILTETDGPTSLEWVNGKYGHPSYIKTILSYISRRKNLPLDRVIKQVEDNALALGFAFQ